MISTIVGFGASTVQGIGDPQGGFLRRVEASLAGTGGARVVNLGIGGQTTRDFLRRTEELQGLRPYAVVVQLGCNDVPRARDHAPEIRVPLAEYAENVCALLPAVRGARTLFVSSFRVSEERTGVTPEVFGAYVAAATDLARAAGYDVWDLYQETHAEAPRYWAEDGLHFNADGHAMIARRVCEWLAGGVSL